MFSGGREQYSENQKKKSNQARNISVVRWILNWISDYLGMEICIDFRQVSVIPISLRVIIVEEAVESSLCPLCFLTNSCSTSLLCCLRVWTHMPLLFHKLGTTMTYRDGKYNENLSLFQSHTHTLIQMIILICIYTYIHVLKNLWFNMVFQISGER